QQNQGHNCQLQGTEKIPQPVRKTYLLAQMFAPGREDDISVLGHPHKTEAAEAKQNLFCTTAALVKII
ncbi:MAG: hypothetical protein P8Y73_09060, partial [Desulfuromonadales bacterium]